MTAPHIMLPPTERDFEIHRQSLVEYLSTRQIADRHNISQTRVRQVIDRVSQWLAATIPIKAELERDAETRLAQHLAAEQLRHQCQQLRVHWDGTSDPKFLRHQTRVILAMARLGIVPGTIDALIASAERGAGVSPALQVSDVADRSEDQNLPAAPTSDLGRPEACPPNVACSADSVSTAVDETPATEAFAASDTEDNVSDTLAATDEQALQGLVIMENRLLTLIDQTGDQDPDRRTSLEESLVNIRQSKAALEIKISPERVGATITAPRYAEGSPTIAPAFDPGLQTSQP